MNFQQFTKRIKQDICGTQIQEESECLGHSIIFSSEGKVLVDFKETELKSIEEAKQYIKQIVLEEELAQELYENIPSIKIAKLIQEHHSVKVTDKLIESYIDLASSKIFTTDPVVYGIRMMNLLDNTIAGKIDYVLEDGSIIAIDEKTNDAINKLLANNSDIVHHMRESKNNFLSVMKELS